jgi:hypothetical protein
VAGSPLSVGNVHVFDWPSIVTCSIGSRVCMLKTVPVRLLALVALAQGYPLWIGSFVRDAELSAVARSPTRGHFPPVSSTVASQSRLSPGAPLLVILLV